MNKVLTLLALAAVISLSSCKKEQKSCCSGENETKVEQKSCCKGEAATETVAELVTPETVMESGAELVGKEVKIAGTVTHICKHGGKKCSIMGETPEAFVQVMAGEEIGSFPTEVMGSNILVKGIVRERQITKEVIAEQEAAAAEKAAKAETAEGKEHCSHSMHNINKMKQWMEENQKDYYPVYFVEGLSYEVAE